MPGEFAIHGQRLRVRFLTAGDRYAHVVSLGTAERDWPLLESVEGAADESWPASPVLQAHHVERLPGDRRLALLVGMAGRSHWSLAAEVIMEHGAERLVFDIACRVASAPERLGSRYRLGPAVRWDAESRVLHTPLGAVRLSINGDEAAAEVRLADSANAIEIVPRSPPPTPPATIRWKFAIATC